MSHFYLPFSLPFGIFLIVGGALSRRYPRLRRPFGIVAGLAIIAMGVALQLLFPGHAAPALFFWAAMAVGALLTVGAALDWLPVQEDNAALRADTARPPRHFGETT